MALPFFYIEDFDPLAQFITLDEDNSKHVVQVLRMKAGEQLHLTDGRGSLLLAEIMEADKRHCTVKLMAVKQQPPNKKQVSIAISVLKNANRFEWFLEKATEIGISEIIPLLCSRTERQHFRFDRMKNILISAMLQSQQCWLPVLRKPVAFADIQMNQFANYLKLVAHCEEEEEEKKTISQFPNFSHQPSIILIGPEGDFTKDEINIALQEGFIPVTLGETRLRAETAGVVAAALLMNI
jgi:16S rRNA (uracil1498-N3)-methyltransferase